MKKAFLIIDVQYDYFSNGRCPLSHPENALRIIQKMLFDFRKKQYPVFFIQHIGNEQATFFIPQTDGVRIHDDIAPLPNESIIVKHTPNSFYQTTLQEELQMLDISELVICGMMTHMCVDTTVRAAKDLGYKVTLIEDGCATKDLMWEKELLPAAIVQNVYMASLHQKFANILTSSKFLSMK